jgi:hypothetical protein
VGRALDRLGIEHIPAYSPEARGRTNVKARVKVHAYADGELAIFHGPRLLARYDRDGALTGSRDVKAAA